MKWAGMRSDVLKNTVVAKCEVERPFGRLRRRWEDNMQMNIKKNSL